jgi:hypothetical protein
MSNTEDGIGQCPVCRYAITAADVLIRYERADDTEGIFADCPACREIVAPE